MQGGHNYLWQQNYEGVVINVDLPPGLKKADVVVEFNPQRLLIRVGESIELKGRLCETVDVSECTWVIDDGKLEVHLTKVLKGEVWNGVFEGDPQLDEINKENDKKRILLERFQHEHPGFDFSDANFNGMIPEPRTFMRDN